MQVQTRAVETARIVRLAALVCVAAAGAVTAVCAAFGIPLVGGAVAAGVLIGTLNGAAASRLIQLPVPFMATSLLRIASFSMLGIGVGLAFGISRIWLVILGLAVAQFILAAAAVREAVHR
jgi:hypothetical protein